LLADFLSTVDYRQVSEIGYLIRAKSMTSFGIFDQLIDAGYILALVGDITFKLTEARK
jgi:hypothetical protein